MAVTSYEVVRRTIEFDGPCRMPLRFDALGFSDIHSAGWNQLGTGDHDRSRTVDEWGCTWARSEVVNMGQVKGHPLEDWATIGSYRWPDPDDSGLYEGMEARVGDGGDKYVVTGIFMLLFERMHALRGFENTLIDLHQHRGRSELLADRIVDFDLAIIRNISQRFPAGIHGFSFTDDWGTQRDLIVDPHLWRTFFKPRYERIFRAAHEAGWHVWMHSCGRINAIIGDLIEIGLDVINLQQPRALGIEEIGRRFRGKICFETLCDIQHTLPQGDADDILREAQMLLEHWGTPEGGFILSDYGDDRAIGVSGATKRTMLEAFLANDPWQRTTSVSGR